MHSADITTRNFANKVSLFYVDRMKKRLTNSPQLTVNVVEGCYVLQLTLQQWGDQLFCRAMQSIWYRRTSVATTMPPHLALLTAVRNRRLQSAALNYSQILATCHLLCKNLFKMRSSRYKLHVRRELFQFYSS